MRDFPGTPIEMLASIWRNRYLIHTMTKREIMSRYRGSTLGLLWSFLNPMLMLIMYTFIFCEVFKIRWSTGSESKTEFAFLLFVGLLVYNLFAESINRAPLLILSNQNYVKKVVFPLEILPFVSFLSTLYHMLISLVIWLLAYSILVGLPHTTALLFPLVMIPFSLFILGLSWVFASLGLFFRDVSQFISIVVTTLMFMSPIFYPASAFPATYREFLYLNPLTPVIEISRDVLYWGKLPEFRNLATYWAATGIVAWLGFAWFQRTRKVFADVL